MQNNFPLYGDNEDVASGRITGPVAYDYESVLESYNKCNDLMSNEAMKYKNLTGIEGKYHAGNLFTPNSMYGNSYEKIFSVRRFEPVWTFRENLSAKNTAASDPSVGSGDHTYGRTALNNLVLPPHMEKSVNLMLKLDIPHDYIMEFIASKMVFLGIADTEKSVDFSGSKKALSNKGSFAIRWRGVATIPVAKGQRITAGMKLRFVPPTPEQYNGNGWYYNKGVRIDVEGKILLYAEPINTATNYGRISKWVINYITNPYPIEKAQAEFSVLGNTSSIPLISFPTALKSFAIHSGIALVHHLIAAGMLMPVTYGIRDNSGNGMTFSGVAYGDEQTAKKFIQSSNTRTLDSHGYFSLNFSEVFSEYNSIDSGNIYKDLITGYGTEIQPLSGNDSTSQMNAKTAVIGDMMFEMAEETSILLFNLFGEGTAAETPADQNRYLSEGRWYGWNKQDKLRIINKSEKLLLAFLRTVVGGLDELNGQGQFAFGENPRNSNWKTKAFKRVSTTSSEEVIDQTRDSGILSAYSQTVPKYFLTEMIEGLKYLFTSDATATTTGTEGGTVRIIL